MTLTPIPPSTAFSKFFNPYERRDRRGRWTKGEISTTSVTPKVSANTLTWLADRGITPASLYSQSASLLDSASPHALNYGTPWYHAAHGVASSLATTHHTDHETASAVLAALSPRNKWRYSHDPKYMTSGNIADAHKVLFNVDNPINITVTPAGAARAHKMYKVNVDHLIGQTVSTSTLSGREQAALDRRTGGLPDNFLKAYRLAKHEATPHEALGGAKVRSFYNNIRRPDTSLSATIDSHQVRAMIGRIDLPDKVYEEIASNDGRYQLFADVIRQLAAERHMSPHQVQAIMWEEWRLRHPDDVREASNPSNIATAADVTLGNVTYSAPIVAKTPKKPRVRPKKA